MPKIQTLGHPSKRTWFMYEGNVKQDVKLIQTGNPKISHELFDAALEHFSGKSIPGGFSMTNPIPGGFGEWVLNNSRKYGCSLSPRHGSFIAAILVHEGYIKSSLEGNRVILHFTISNH